MRFLKPSKRGTSKPASDHPAGETRVPTGMSGISRPSQEEFTAVMIRLNDSIKAHNEEAQARAQAQAQAQDRAQDLAAAKEAEKASGARPKAEPILDGKVGPLTQAAVAEAGAGSMNELVRILTSGDPAPWHEAAHAAEEAKINPRTRSAMLDDIDLPGIVAELQELHRTAVHPEADMEMVKSVSAILTPEELIQFSTLLFDADYIELGYICLAQYRESTGSAYFSQALLRASTRAAAAKPITVELVGEHTSTFTAPATGEHAPLYTDPATRDDEDKEADQEAEDADDFDADQLREDLFVARNQRRIAERYGDTQRASSLTDAQIGEMIRRGQEHPAAPVRIPGFTNHAQFNLEELADEMTAAKPTEEDAAAIAALATELDDEDSLTLTPEEAKQIADAESVHATSAEEEAARAYLISLGYNPDLVSEARIQRHGTTVHHRGADGRHLTNFHPAVKYGTLGGLK